MRSQTPRREKTGFTPAGKDGGVRVDCSTHLDGTRITMSRWLLSSTYFIFVRPIQAELPHVR